MRHTAKFLAAAATAALTAGLVAPITTAQAADVDARKAAKPFIKVSADKTDVTFGDKIKLTGKIKPKTFKGRKIVIEQLRKGDNKWKRTGTVKVKKSGKFVFKEVPTTAVSRQYRAVLPKTRRNRMVVSSPVSITMWEWKGVDKLAYARGDGMMSYGSSVAGVPAPNSLVQFSSVGATPATIEYNLYKVCTQMKTDLALSDHSAVGTTNGRVLLDGVQKATASVSTLGAKAPLAADVTDVFRVTFELDRAAATPASPVVGQFVTPTFFCHD